MNFDIEGARKAGYSDSEIADHLASSAKFDSAAARKAGYSDAEIIGHLGQKAAPEAPQKPELMQRMQNVAAGALRGAGSIGATLMTPYDLLVGNTKSLGNPERRQGMDDALASLGVQTDSTGYGVGKLGGEIAGTLGVGPALAGGARALGAAPTAVNALQSAGFSTGAEVAPNALARLADMGTRVVAGGLVGGASAGMVDPSTAGAGAAVGAALPPVLAGVGKVGGAAGRILRGPEQSPEMASAIRQAQKAGYMIPPTQANPTLGNRLMEGMSGKITTAQNASAKNAPVTSRLAAEAIGLPGNTQITPEVLKDVRKVAGQAYEAVGSTGVVTPGPAYTQALDDAMTAAKTAAAGFPNAKPSPLIAELESLKSPQFDSASAVAKISQLREQADTAYRAGDKSLGKGLKSGARALEDALDAHLVGLDVPPEMLQGYRDARTLIAKTYTVESALNPTTGAIDARKLGQALKRGKPMTDELRTAGEFANRFPKAAQPIENMGSLPQTSPLDWTAGGSISLATGNPLGMLGVVARPAARAAILSPMVQRRLIQQPSALSQLIEGPEQALYRTAPLLTSPGQ